MTTTRDLERRLAEHFIGEAPSRAPDWILPSALTTIETTRQRRGPYAPWRFPDMQTYAKAAAVVAVLAIGAVAAWQLGLSPDPGATQQPTTPPSPPVTAPPSVVPSSGLPRLTQTYVSPTHGISLSYPDGWLTSPATEAWTGTAPPGFGSTSGDLIFHPTLRDKLFLVVASQPLAGRSGEVWADEVAADPGWDGPCPTETPIDVDGADGRLCGEPLRVMFWDDVRGYFILLYTSSSAGAYDLQYFEGILETVQLNP